MSPELDTISCDERSSAIDAVAVCVQRHAYSPDVLAVQRREDIGVRFPIRLCMPGGKVESRETARAAAVRELLEETGVNVRAEGLRWLGAIEVESRTKGLLAVGVFWVLAPCTYEPGPGMGEPAMVPRWHALADLADEFAHGRFAGPALFAHQRIGILHGRTR